MARSDAWLLAFARLLPAEFRERVFEPALADLRLGENQTIGRPPSAWMSRFVLVAECLRLGTPQLLWRRGRPTRLATVVVGLLGVVSLLLLRWSYAYSATRR